MVHGAARVSREIRKEPLGDCPHLATLAGHAGLLADVVRRLGEGELHAVVREGGLELDGDARVLHVPEPDGDLRDAVRVERLDVVAALAVDLRLVLDR